MTTSKDRLTKKERQANVTRILNALNPTDHNFNTMLIGFADIIQSQFYNSRMAICENDKEVAEFLKAVEDGVKGVVKTLNRYRTSEADDMIILSTVMLEVINSAMLRQEELGLPVDPKIARPKRPAPNTEPQKL